MASFLTTRGIESSIEDIIKHAQKNLILITPYLQTTPTIIERMKDAARRGVKTTLVCRAGDLRDSQKNEITAISGVQLFFMESLHAKFYANEKHALLTSMNLYEASRKNREMGILLNQNEQAFNDAMVEVQSIVSNSTLHLQTALSPDKSPSNKQNISIPQRSQIAGDTPHKPKPTPNTPLHTNKPRESTKPPLKPSQSSSKGHCIRCNTEIVCSMDKPMCKACYTTWSKFKNMDYEETYCHTCGSDRVKTISMNKPQCYACWKT